MSLNTVDGARRDGKAARVLAILLLGMMIAWTTTMLASLHWRFLDAFVAGTGHGCIGNDFFQVPRAFKNLTAGNNIFLTEISDYGPYATSYFYHPVIAVLVGPWTAPFPPWTAYGIFVAASLVLLAIGGWLLSSAFEDPAAKAFAFFVLFCSMPTYLMLWNAQMHVFLVLAVILILAGLMRLAQGEEPANLYLRWIQVGVLISLLSKPTVLLMLPVLFALPETRRKLVAPVVIYAVVSLLFLISPTLNPGNYNALHWINIFRTSSSPMHVYRLVFPFNLDYSTSPEVYSMPVLLMQMFGQSVPSFIFKLPLLVILAMSVLPLALSERLQRIRVATVVVALCVLSHYLCYFVAYEYHYVTMLPLLPLLIWLWRGEEVRLLRCLLQATFVISLVVFVPTANILSGGDSKNMWMACSMERVLPIIAAFVLLAVYGVARTWLGVRDHWSETWATIVAQSRMAERPAAVIGILLATVATVALVTAPDRLLTQPDKWAAQDWPEHFEDILSRPGITPAVGADIHRSLALINVATDPQRSWKEYQIAHSLVPNDAVLTLEMADFCIASKRPESAKKLLSGINPKCVAKPDLREKYDRLCKMVDAK